MTLCLSCPSGGVGKYDIYKYIYIVIHRQICFVLSELISVAWHISFPLLGSKPGWLKRQSKPLTLQPRGASSCEVNFKRLWITITIVYIHPFNGYRDLNSYMKRLAINANGNTITSFAGKLKPTGVGEYISFSLSLSLYIYIYIYIYHYIIALSQILSNLQIIPHLVCHKPKWNSDNHTPL